MNIEQKGISSADQTSAGQTGPRYSLLFKIPFFQYSLIHDLALCSVFILIFKMKLFFTVLAAIFLTCFSCWLKRLLSKRRISKEEAEDGEIRKKDFTGNGPDVVVNFIMRFCETKIERSIFQESPHLCIRLHSIITRVVNFYLDNSMQRKLYTYILCIFRLYHA